MSDESRDQIIEEDEFKSLFGAYAEPFLAYVTALLRQDHRDWKKGHYSQLASMCLDVETFLDDFDARNNRSFAYPTELIASLRGLARVGISVKHLTTRYARYNVTFSAKLAGKFFEETDRTVKFIDQSILAIMRQLRSQIDGLGVPVPESSRLVESKKEERDHRALPNDIDEEDLLNEERKIAELATRYLEVSARMSQLLPPKTSDVETLKRFALEVVDEERSREIEAQVHSLQSKYDTYVRSTSLESGTPSLPKIRGHVSLALHLSEISTELLHFYVRHENDIRYEAAKAAVADLVDKREVLDRTFSYAFRFAIEVMRTGEMFAKEVLESFVQVKDLLVEIPVGTTLHARPISLITKIVNHHATLVVMELEGESCNAASIMELILMAGNNPSSRQVRFRGDARALEDLRSLFDHQLGERGLDQLPDSLGYLR